MVMSVAPIKVTVLCMLSSSGSGFSAVFPRLAQAKPPRGGVSLTSERGRVDAC
jgi:hypothetical protein